MTIEERLEAISERQEVDGQHIHQIVVLVADLTESTKRTANAIDTLLQITASHETRLSRIEDRQQ